MTDAANPAPYPNPVVARIMRLAQSPSVADDGRLTASGTLTGQPLAVRNIGLALFAATWDKDDHG